MAGLGIAVAVQDQDIAGLGGIDALVKGQVVTGEAADSHGSPSHVAVRIQRLDAGIHDPLSGDAVIIVGHIACGKLFQDFHRFFCQFHFILLFFSLSSAS